MNSLAKTLLCLIATLPTVQAVTVIDGDTSTGNPRGTDAIDIQSKRELTPQVASGPLSMAFGHSNAASAERSVAIGWENTVSGFEAMAFGDGNQVTAAGAFAFGSAIINSVPNSVMIGPSDGSKLTILSNGTVGIGTTSPSSNEQLDIRGSLAVSAIKGNTTTFNGTPLPGDTAPRKLFFNIQSDGESKKYKIASIQFTGGLSWSSLQGWLQLGGNHAMYERTAEFEIRAFNMHNPSASELRYIKRGQQTSALSVYKTEDWNGLGHDQYDIYVQTGFHTDAQGEITFIAKGNHGNVSVTAWQQGLDCGTGEAIGEQKLPDSDYVFDTSGNVGIGTGNTSPTEKLDVAGNIKLSGNIIGATGTTLLRSSASGATLGGSTAADQITISNIGQLGAGITPAAGAGKIQLAAGTTPANGIRFGEDTNLYRRQSDTLHTDSLLSTDKGLIANASFIWSGTAPSLPNGVGNQVTYIDFGDTRFWGWMEVTLSSGYNNQQATGRLTKRFDIGRNTEDDGQYIGTSEVVAAHGRIAAQWKIGDPQIFEGRLRIPVYHVVSKGNPLHVQIEGMRHPDAWIMTTATFLSGITLTAPTTLANTETRDYPYTLSERTGFGGPATEGRIQLAASTNEAGGIYWGTDTNLYRSAPDTLKTDDSLAVMDKLGVGTPAPAATLDVNGTVQIAGDVKIKNRAVIRVSAAGDIGMGAFTSGTDPEL